ncbi:imidazole glycerol phosphate synthase subunit HisH [Photorhabdus aegyptia]|uniref:Imidazole glycerol phosphate synthase subunit HisH n=1 Tax=Photorhabdus aegyptia TaxID=2805098 RepID=A0A022PFC5_9GAMM|nr:imidazole glycerol phosphate synthase subunit HisH [Photorhabdus aegyptia]EYU14234.1 imidazole glycerol phosphate synthase, glutamine amidotransferase subunit [Photorhabdus aegyptia]KGM27567.1 imidazole glycerol phosphate synthase [Photorhabdus luminescens]
MIRIVDYGVGNIQAFMNMFKRLGVLAERAHSAVDLQDATHLILPGVGAFDHAMEMFNKSGMRPALEELVLSKRLPILGICVGMQMLAGRSDEGKLKGLNWIPGQVCSFASNPQAASFPMPHMGWNDLTVKSGSSLFKNLESSPRFYFLHSYYFECENPSHVAASANYGFDFDCVISSGNIHGVQCHPEKSHRFGAQLLKNFSEL